MTAPAQGCSCDRLTIDRFQCVSHGVQFVSDVVPDICPVGVMARELGYSLDSWDRCWKERDGLRAELAEVRAQLDERTATNARLNRRCQEYEAGLRSKLDQVNGGLGRMLANAAARMFKEEAEALRSRVALLEEVVEAARPFGCRDPQVCGSELCAALARLDAPAGKEALDDLAAESQRMGMYPGRLLTRHTDRVHITRPVLSVCHMQVCAVSDATDDEILEVCNRMNPSGTSNGWSEVVRSGHGAPVQCEDESWRTHFLVVC